MPGWFSWPQVVPGDSARERAQHLDYLDFMFNLLFSAAGYFTNGGGLEASNQTQYVAFVCVWIG